MEKLIVSVKGRKVFYNHWGEGQTMVLLHGIPTDSRLWDSMIPYLEPYYSVYAFDLLGFGRSEKLDSTKLDLRSQAEFFLDVFKELSLKEITIVGHDIGGGIAQIMAVESPKVFKSMVLMDSACYDSWPIQLLTAGQKLELLFQHLPQDVLYDLFKGYIEEGLYNKDKADAIAEKYWPLLQDKDGIETFLKAVESLDNRYTIEVSRYLYDIRMPVLILWGRHDKFIRLSYAFRLNEDIRNSQISIIEEGGHFLPEDNPEETAKTIHDFIKNNG